MVTQIEISDPVAHELFICMPKEQVCQVEDFDAPSSGSENCGYARQREFAGSGKQSVGGVETIGTRETVVIEAGKIGNDSPIQVQREYWYSPQLGVNLTSRLQDPRVGIQNFDVSDIALTEPDANLFKVSSKMKVIDLRARSEQPASDEVK